MSRYEEFYRQSVDAPEAFWAEQAKLIDWQTPAQQILDASQPPFARWFVGGTTNLCHNAVDRHLPGRGDQPALIFVSTETGVEKSYSFAELHAEVQRTAASLIELGVGKGDRVLIYMPMIPEAAFAMLACARIGAIHCVVFGGFASGSLATRIEDAEPKVVVSADAGSRGGKVIAYKPLLDEAIRLSRHKPSAVLLTDRGLAPMDLAAGRDHLAAELARRHHDTDVPCAWLAATDISYTIYTSGTTGKPKGVQRDVGGYAVALAASMKHIFDGRAGETYFSTSDIGWVVGHSYIVYGPLANGATALVFEGVPNYPSVSRFWEVIDKHQVTLFYTAPTAIRALMRDGDEPVKKTSRSSLRLLGTVGEPINPEAWRWYYEVVGDSRSPIVDTWWQTETGGILITPLAGAIDLKPGSATKPFFGVQPALVDANGARLEGEAEGNLVLLDSWPGQMRTVYGDHQRFIDTYFRTYPGTYFTGDGCRRDADGYYWITGRVDDVINVSGHRIGTAEVESALVSHPKVAEAAVVGFPHDIKGQGIYAYVTLIAGEAPTDALHKELVAHVRKEIGPIATPDHLQWAPGLPKTRSGKIMRRILRKIAENAPDQLGDTSTLADPTVVESLVRERRVP